MLDLSNRVDRLLDSALAWHEAGELLRAEALYDQILAFDPNHADAIQLRGVIAHQRGDHLAAAAAIQRALALQPGNANYLSNLGLCYQELGRLPEAIETFQAALRSKPRMAAAAANLGGALLAAGRVADAETWCREAIRLDPAAAGAHNGLGAVLGRQQKLDEAILCFRTAVRINGRHASAMINLAAALRDQGKLDEAEAWSRRAIGIDPNIAEAHDGLALILSRQGRIAESIAGFQEAVRLAPGRADTRRNLGHAYSDSGQFDLAKQQFAEVLNLLPGDPITSYSLSLIHRFTAGDRPMLQQLETLVQGGGLSALHRRQAGFALGKAFDDLGEYDRAFGHFQAVNELARAAFDRHQYQATIDFLIAEFPPSRRRHAGHSGSDSTLPVFIVGMPRSGTSLVEQILASHPQVYGGGELTDIVELANELWGPSPAPSAGPPADVTELAASPTQLAACAEMYLNHRRAVAGTAMRVTDKMPYNYLFLGLIALLFPQARVIHCRRDPRDTCLSCYFTDFRHRPVYSYRLDDLGFVYQQYQRLMEHWRRDPPLEMLEVDYETLVQRPEDLARRMVDFCGLNWDDRCLCPHQNPRPVMSSSAWQVRKPIYQHSVGRWKHYAAHIGPLLRMFEEPPTTEIEAT